MEITLKTLRANKRVREMLLAFDFEVVDLPSDHTWFKTDNLQPFKILAKRGSGCLFSMFGPRQSILLVKRRRSGRRCCKSTRVFGARGTLSLLARHGDAL